MASNFLSVVGIAAWYACSVFCFWLAMRARPGREQQGRTLVGVGALFMATALVLPAQGPIGLPAIALALLVVVAGVALIFGLYLCFPQGGLVSVVRKPEPVDEEEPGESDEGDEDPDADEEA